MRDLSLSTTASMVSPSARAATTCVLLELLEASFARNGGGVPATDQLNMFQRCTNSLRRTLKTLGLRRRPRDVHAIPSVEEYLQSKRMPEADHVAADADE